MYVLVYFIILGISTYVINKINNVESNNEFLKWSKREIIIISAFFLLAVLLQIFSFILPDIFVLVYAFVATVGLVYANKNRERTIQEYQKQLEQVYDSIAPLNNKDAEEIDYNNLPFKIKKEGDKINEIEVTHINPKKHTDPNCTNVVYSLKNYFPYYDWQYTIDYPKQITTFSGQKLPPEMALWPGSDLRDPAFIPVGLGGAGEVGLNIGAKDLGESSYQYEDGAYAGDVKLPSAPQYLVVGSPLSIDTIIPTTTGYKTMEDINRGDYVFGGDNTPVMVSEVHQIHLEKSVYELEFVNDVNEIKIVADGIHKFPTNFGDKTVEEIYTLCNDNKSVYTEGISNTSTVKFKVAIKKCSTPTKVRCITVNSHEHLFLVTDRKHKGWNGGKSYPFAAVKTHNTGGGKSIWVEQELW